MKHKILAFTLLALGLSACGTTKVNVADNRADELKTIQRVCIIPNPKRTPHGLEQVIARSLQNQGIEAEIVDVAANRQRLYEPECRYNLRYISAGNPEMIKKIAMILRTPDYHVANLGYNVNDEPEYRRSPNLQQQTDGIIARLLGKKAQ